MRLFGISITRAARPETLHPVDSWGSGAGRGWWPIIRDWYPGAWQRNDELCLEDWLSYWPVFRCIELIASDISKMRLKLVELSVDGIWRETESPAFSPVIRKPNAYQNRIQFFGSWMQSRLIHGNTYVLKLRDQRGIVTGMMVLDPRRVSTLIAPNGDVYYELRGGDWQPMPGVGDFTNVEQTVVAPAREIIHDRVDTFYHPLVGLSKMYAAGMLATQGLRIQKNSATFFANGSNPGGVLTAPGAISDETAKRLKDHWDQNYSGANVGKVAVLGDGLKYEPMATKAVDAQLLEQLKFTAEAVCGVFGVPPYKLGLGPMPTANNVEALDQQYYSQCLQASIEAIELCLDEGLGIGIGNKVDGKIYGTEFDLDDLLRMDTATLIKAEADAVGAGIKAPNEARLRLNLPPVIGGDTPYLQQQNFSLAALDKRDKDDPFTKPEPAPELAPEDAEPVDERFIAEWKLRTLTWRHADA
jgi:HK97 family phage portal protein